MNGAGLPLVPSADLVGAVARAHSRGEAAS